MPTRFQKNLRDLLITDERFTTATITTFIWEFAEKLCALCKRDKVFGICKRGHSTGILTTEYSKYTEKISAPLWLCGSFSTTGDPPGRPCRLDERAIPLVRMLFFVA